MYSFHAHEYLWIWLGTAIYIYFILAEKHRATTITQCDFSVDGGRRTPFTHTPSKVSTAIRYNQLVFSQTDLPNDQHKMKISTSGINHDVWVNFDYAVYT
jgi:hypothetical protein